MTGAGFALSGWLRPRLPLRTLALLALGTAGLAALYLLWFRDSPLVAVKSVRVEGLRAKGDERLRQALTAEAEGMTTLHVREDVLREVAADFPLVESVSADPSFPSSLTVRVTERVPAAVAEIEGEDLVVASDGTILPGVDPHDAGLPSLRMERAPDGDRLRGSALEKALVLGAAPGVLRPYLASAFEGPDGIEVELAGGITLRFGRGEKAEEKWRAAVAVLSDPELGALDYVDLTAPTRPAVGGASHLAPPVSSD